MMVQHICYISDTGKRDFFPGMIKIEMMIDVCLQ